MSFMLSVTYKPLMLSVFMLNVVMLSVIMLSVIMLSVVILCVVVAPFVCSAYGHNKPFILVNYIL